MLRNVAVLLRLARGFGRIAAEIGGSATARGEEASEDGVDEGAEDDLSAAGVTMY